MFEFLRKSKSWKEYFEEGMRYGAASNFTRAEGSFRRAIRLAPNEPYPHYELGYTLSLVGRHKEALEEFEKTESLARGFFLVQTEAYISKQAVSGAIDEGIVQKLRELQHLTDRKAGTGNEAVTESKAVIARAPKCALGHFYLGKALLESNPAAAELSLKRCVELSPDETTAIDAKFHLGFCAATRAKKRQRG